MEAISTYFRLASGSLFLREQAFVEVRDKASPFRTGLTLLLVIAVVVSALNVVGVVLEWVTTPDVSRIQETVWQGIMEMPFFEQMSPEARQEVRRQFEFGWQIFPSLFGAPNPIEAGLNVLVTPLALVAGWLVFGFVAHFFARLFGGTASLSQTYGCTALAVSPRLLGIVHLVPYVSFWGGLIGLWALTCNYLALKYGHDLSVERAFWALLLALIVVVAFAFLIFGGAAALVGYFLFGNFAGFMGGGS